jgi:hypothetical protein
LSRLKVLVTQPRMALGALLTVALATAAVVGSGADFTASSANPENVFTAGTLTMQSSTEGAIVTAADMRPGAVAQRGVIDIENTGSLSGTFALSRGAVVDSDTANPLSDKLNITIRDCGLYADGTAPTCETSDTVVYDGTVAGMGTAARTLGQFSSDARHRYEFALALDRSADDAYQGDRAEFGFTWTAVS